MARYTRSYASLQDKLVHCWVTSPPYFDRRDSHSVKYLSVCSGIEAATSVGALTNQREDGSDATAGG